MNTVLYSPIDVDMWDISRTHNVQRVVQNITFTYIFKLLFVGKTHTVEVSRCLTSVTFALFRLHSCVSGVLRRMSNGCLNLQDTA